MPVLERRMIVLEEETMEEQPKYYFQPPDPKMNAGTGVWTDTGQPIGSIGPVPDRPTPDQQIRMKALELGIRWLTQEPPQPSEAAPDINEALFWSCVRDFEDYLKKGRL